MLPSFLIIGAQKSASTLLHAHLVAHPQVYMPTAEVPTFEDPYYLEHGIVSLHRLFDNAPSDMLLGIKRPDYLAREECPPRIARHIPDAKLVVILRSPVERALSAYYHYMREGWIPVRPVESGLPLVLDGTYRADYPRAGEIVAFGFYYRHLQRYYRSFARAQVCVMLQEDLIRDTNMSLQRVHRFLGLEEECSSLAPLTRAKEGLYSLPRLRFLELARPLTHSFSADRRGSEAKLGVVGRAVRAFDSRILSRVFTEVRPSLGVKLQGQLAGLYHGDICSLEGELRRDLGHWRGNSEG